MVFLVLSSPDLGLTTGLYLALNCLIVCNKKLHMSICDLIISFCVQFTSCYLGILMIINDIKS